MKKENDKPQSNIKVPKIIVIRPKNINAFSWASSNKDRLGFIFYFVKS